MDENREKTFEEENLEKDPMMRFDAFMAGVKDGGLRSISAIYLTVCYIVKTLSDKVTADVITEALTGGMIANYFEVANAVAKLIKSGTLVEADDGTLSISKNTNADIDLVEKDLPYTVRERSIKLCQKILAKEMYRRENKVDIIPVGDAFTVDMHIGDDKTEYMNLKLFAPTMEQARMIKEKFISDPVSVYDNLITSIFSNEE